MVCYIWDKCSISMQYINTVYNAVYQCSISMQYINTVYNAVYQCSISMQYIITPCMHQCPMSWPSEAMLSDLASHMTVNHNHRTVYRWSGYLYTFNENIFLSLTNKPCVKFAMHRLLAQASQYHLRPCIS